MARSLIERIFRRHAGNFVSEARARGLSLRVARRLEPAAGELEAENPERVLASRELFEQAAMGAVVVDVANLELSFQIVDSLASAVETLGLARTSDIPDPFRRVWVRTEEGLRLSGVVLTCRDGEIAVYCSPGAEPIMGTGRMLNLQYRGFSSTVEYDLKLNDSVLLPGGQVLHLTRPDHGHIGRFNQRHEVHIHGRVRALDADACDETGNEVLEGEFDPCEIIDVSPKGMRMECDEAYEVGRTLAIEVPLPDGNDAPFAARGIVRWSSDGLGVRHSYGIRFKDLPAELAERMERFVSTLRLGDSDSG